MANKHLIFLTVPGLRAADLDRAATPTLYSWADSGALGQLVPTFPCVTSPVQATMMTGRPPRSHGVIANGFYHRDRQEVEFWVGHNHVINGPQLWDAVRSKGNRLTSAVWHVQNIKEAAADFIVTPSPIHEPDGTTKLWCYSKPEGLYQQLLDSLGHFPLQHYWGPISNIESTRWILNAVLRLVERHAPNFQWVYVPHLDYAAQKFGPNSPQAKQSLVDLDARLAEFAAGVNASSIGKDVVYLVAGEYALTDVVGAIHPNRILREAGLLEVREENGAEVPDLQRSKAFALVDHQLTHVYLNPSLSNANQACGQVCELFREVPFVDTVAAGHERAELGVDHPRSGEVVLVSDDAHWFAYYWWQNDAAAPRFARTVDIHRKPGYDPVELFFDPVSKGIPLDSGLVKGSHGVPATSPRHQTALICSAATHSVESGHTYRDSDLYRMNLELLGLA